MTLRYKGYVGKADIDEKEKMIVGRVINMAKDGITFAGKTVEETRQDFKDAVDDYLAWAGEEGFEPEKPYRGEFLVRTTPKLHREIATASALLNKSLNQFVVDALQRQTHLIEDMLVSQKENGKFALEHHYAKVGDFQAKALSKLQGRVSAKKPAEHSKK